MKPELASHEGLYDMEVELGLPVRFAWVMLFTACDREGRFQWRPRTLKAQILPHDDLDLSRVLDAWGTRGYVRKYRVGDEWFGWIPTWRKHQVINNRESQSDIPPIDQADEQYQWDTDASATREPLVLDACVTPAKGKGKEGKGKEGKKQAAPDGALDGVWGPGLQVLLSTNVPEHHARAFIGALLATWEASDVLEALQAASGKADARGYVRGVLKAKPKKSKVGNGDDPVLAALREKYGPEVRLAQDGHDYWLPESNRRWFLNGEQKAAL